MAIKIPEVNHPLTVGDILADSEIPKLRWEEIIIEENIGHGASGIVSRGRWNEYVSFSEK